MPFPEGTFIGHPGKYLIFGRPNHLTFTWAPDDDEGHDSVHVQINSDKNGASVQVIHTIDEQWKKYTNSIRQSWGSMLNEMEKLLR